MKTRGFTLVELLGVVTILAMLGLIIVPTVNKVLSDNKRKLYNVQIRSIESGTSDFVTKNILGIDIPINSSVGITLGDLKRLGFIDTDITDPISRSKFSDSMSIIITNTDKGYSYTVCTNEVSCDLNVPFYGDDCAEIFC